MRPRSVSSFASTSCSNSATVWVCRVPVCEKGVVASGKPASRHRRRNSAGSAVPSRPFALMKPLDRRGAGRAQRADDAASDVGAAHAGGRRSVHGQIVEVSATFGREPTAAEGTGEAGSGEPGCSARRASGTSANWVPSCGRRRAAARPARRRREPSPLVGTLSCRDLLAEQPVHRSGGHGGHEHCRAGRSIRLDLLGRRPDEPDAARRARSARASPRAGRPSSAARRT